MKLLKKIYKNIPKKYQEKVPNFLLLSFLNLFLEIFSLAILFPLILMLINKNSEHVDQVYSFLNFNSFVKNKVLFFVVLIIILFFIIKNFISIKIIKYQTKIAYNISSEIASKITKSYILNDYLKFKKEKKSLIIRNVINVANDFSNFVLLPINTILIEFFLLATIIVACVFIDPKITFLLLVITLCTLLILFFISKKGTKKIRFFIAQNYSKNISNLMNIINGFFEIKSSSKEDLFERKFFESNSSLNNKYAYITAKRLSQAKYVEVIVIIILSTLLVMFKYMSNNEDTDILLLSLLLASAIKVIPSINKLSIAFTNLHSYLYTVDIVEKSTFNYNNISAIEKHITSFNQITFKNIRFSYDDKIILNNINFTLKRGGIIGVDGHSGSGKTTFLNILTQLTTSYQGSIYLDDILINNKISYKKLISYMPQEPFILDDTILNNITLCDKNIDLIKINELIKEFSLDSAINSLPKKLNTYIGNDGHNLSGGQKQRLTLIRSILNNPKILILDEATNQLDEKTELEILSFLKKRMKQEKTSIVIVSHNLKNMTSICDQVYKLTDNTLSLINES